MSRLLRPLVLALLGLLLALAAWRVWGELQVDRALAADPPQALAWRPTQPAALLARAEQALAAGRLDAAQADARRLLAAEPLQGEAFRVLAQVADRRGDAARARRLFAIAERRAPRDLPTRAWLAKDALLRGDSRAALVQIDRVLRMAPGQGRTLYPLMARLAQDPAFADALAATLARDPPWRNGLLDALRRTGAGNPLAEGNVMQALKARGALTPQDDARWLDSLMARGRWGEAYARWASRTVRPGERLPAVYNGDFERPLTDTGFDWRLRRVPGVVVQVEPAPGGQGGQAAMLRFLDRRVPQAGLEHPLLLPPGRYRLSLRVRADALRSPLGLQWTVACVGKGGVAGRSDPLDGSFGWRTLEVPLEIPPGCAAQWLRLLNPVAAGAAQQAAGTLWVDDVRVAADSGPERRNSDGGP